MIGWILLALVLLFLAVLLIRTALFRPKDEKAPEPEQTGIDYDKAAEHLARMVRVKTVSSREKASVDEAEFDPIDKLVPIQQCVFDPSIGEYGGFELQLEDF